MIEKIKHLTKEHKRKISDSNIGKNKGKHLSVNTEFKKGQVSWNKGIKSLLPAWNKGLHWSKEVRDKMSISHIGKKMSEETLAKMRIISSRENLSKETLEKRSKALKGIRRTPIWIERIRNSNKGKHYSPKTEITKESRKLVTFPLLDSSIEIKIQNFLKELNIDFFTHQYMKEIEHGYQCDILIPSMKLVIECDGDYWHKYPIGRDIDKIRTSELLQQGFKVLRLWEREIRVMNLEQFEEKLIWKNKN